VRTPDIVIVETKSGKENKRIVRLGVCGGASRIGRLCQNCVSRLKPWANTIMYEDTLKYIVVAGNR